jgi:RNA polymerase sigma-70 factor, ECF subfamily
MDQVNPPSDEALVARMAARDPESISALYDRHRTLIFSLALRILADRSEAEEVLTDVFFQAWRGAERFDSRRGTVVGWLINMCRSRAIDRLRARGRRESGLAAVAGETAASAGGASSGEDPERAADHERKRVRIRAAMGALPPEQRGALELAYFGGLSQSEIAAKLGEPLGTIKTRIRQGLIALREKLAESLS